MNQKKIGSFLKELRKEKGITQEEFAENLMYLEELYLVGRQGLICQILVY